MSTVASRFAVAAAVLLVLACTDSPNATEPTGPSLSRAAAQDGLAELFAAHSPPIMAMAGTVFADHDEVAGKLVFGVENAHAATGIQQALFARGLHPANFEIRVTEPIRQVANLRDVFRPTVGGIQIHFGQYLCTMGFNVDHAAGRSFITNSHCTNKQGGTEGTVYYQPLSSTNGTVIGTEADDPQYFTGDPCSKGKKCRYSDAARVLYSAVESSRGAIARTSGPNNGSLEVTGNFSVTAQDNSNSTGAGATLNKVGRTTGWTQGTVSGTCVTTNVFGSNIQQLCQSFVRKSGSTIVGGGDSGSPVFAITSGSNVTLVGILWGSSGSSEFVYSPLQNIQRELGGLTATASGSGGGDGGDGGGDGGGECVPKGPQGKNCK